MRFPKSTPNVSQSKCREKEPRRDHWGQSGGSIIFTIKDEVGDISKFRQISGPQQRYKRRLDSGFPCNTQCGEKAKDKSLILLFQMGKIPEGSLVGIKPPPTPLTHTEFWQIRKKGNLVSCTFSWCSRLARATGPALQWPPSPPLCAQRTREPGAPPPHLPPRPLRRPTSRSPERQTEPAPLHHHCTYVPREFVMPRPAQGSPSCRPSQHHTTFLAKKFVLPLCHGNGFWVPEANSRCDPHPASPHSKAFSRVASKPLTIWSLPPLGATYHPSKSHASLPPHGPRGASLPLYPVQLAAPAAAASLCLLRRSVQVPASPLP